MSNVWQLVELLPEDKCYKCGSHQQHGYVDEDNEIIICQECAEVLEGEAIDAAIDAAREEFYNETS